MATTPAIPGAQSGVTITRNGYNFTVEWKLTKNVTAQRIRWRWVYRAASGGSDQYSDWSTDDLTASATKYTFNVTSSSYPDGIVFLQVQFRAKYKQSEYGTTDWTDWDRAGGAFQFYKPNKPSFTSENTSSTSVTFTWATETTADDHYWIVRVEYQTISVVDAPAAVGSLTEWNLATLTTKGLTGSQTEGDTVLANVSRTRIARVRAVSFTEQVSDWVYLKRTYATPYTSEITNYNVSVDPSNQKVNIYAEWTVRYNEQHPLDETMLQYRIGKPTANMGVTSDGTWTDVGTYGKSTSSMGSLTAALSGTNGNYKASDSVSLTETIDDDECLWIRVNSSYSGGTSNPGDAVLAYIGKLAGPGAPSISNRNDTTHTVTISCTNNSAVVDSKLAIVYQPDGGDEVIVAVFAHGTSSMSGIQCPNWDDVNVLGFRAFAYVGSESYTTDSAGVKHYTVNARMSSDPAFTSGGIPKAPTITVIKSPDEPNGIRVTWSWAWADANRAEISWSTRSNAWESTAEPETYEVDSTNPGCIDIGDLDAGETYYVRVRLFYESADGVTYGPYSGTARLYLSERPAVPVLTVSRDVVTKDEPDLGVSWTYVSMDGTEQKYAEVDEIVTGGYKPLADATTEQHAMIDTSSWTEGTYHQLVVRVTSGSNETSLWSAAVTVLKAEPPECTITQASLSTASGKYVLDELPLTVTVEGAGTGGSTTVSIVRAETFVQQRPDDSKFSGYVGETILKRTYTGESQQTFTLDDILEGKNLDDTAKYRLVAAVTDTYGQVATDVIDFIVGWSHQAVMPEGTAIIYGDAAYITITEPDGAEEGDTVDIYRLSAGKPEILYRGAEFDSVIVDPFPTIGPYGGYRLAYRTLNGDCTTANNVLAWLDIATDYEPGLQFINFNGQRLDIKYKPELSETSEKDFAKTKYLGGTFGGGWLEGVKRSGSVNGVMLTMEDIEDIKTLDALMAYSGPVRIRTRQGDSYTANVNVVKGLSYASGSQIETVALSIDRIDSAGLDGMTLEEWEES